MVFLGRPKSKYNPKDYTFKLWETNRLEIDKLNLGTRSYEINIALQNHFRMRGKLAQDILFQIEEHKKIIEQHDRAVSVLEEELGLQKEKEENEKLKARSELEEGHKEFILFFKNAHNPFHYCDNKSGVASVKDTFGFTLNKEQITRVLNDDFSLDEYVKLKEGVEK